MSGRVKVLTAGAGGEVSVEPVTNRGPKGPVGRIVVERGAKVATYPVWFNDKNRKVQIGDGELAQEIPGATAHLTLGKAPALNAVLSGNEIQECVATALRLHFEQVPAPRGAGDLSGIPF
jgi:hypothetical protein